MSGGTLYTSQRSLGDCGSRVDENILLYVPLYLKRKHFNCQRVYVLPERQKEKEGESTHQWSIAPQSLLLHFAIPSGLGEYVHTCPALLSSCSTQDLSCSRLCGI